MVKTTFNPPRLLLEAMLVVALAEVTVMLALPVIAPGVSGLTEGLLDVALLLLLSGPALYWRFVLSRSSGHRPLFSPPEQPGKSNVAVLLTALTQCFGLLLTVVGVQWQSSNLDSQSKTRFDQGVERTEAEVLRRLDQSTFGLKGARGAMAASDHLNRADFRAYVESRNLPTEFPGIRGFGFIERVERGALQRFVADERADAAPDFAVRTRGTAADLYVIKYLEPLATNQGALGFDMGQEALRRAAIESAVATGQPTLLGGIELLQDANRSPGFLYFLPVYRKGSSAQTPEQRQRDLLGLLYAPIVASELLQSVTASTHKLIDFALFDGTELNSKALIFDADASLAAATPEARAAAAQARKFVVQKVLTVGGRVMTMRTSSTARFEAAQDRSSLLIIGVGGTLLSFLMAVLVWLLALGRQRAQALASSMTTELKRMAQVVQHTANCVTIMDREMRIVWVNTGFTQITGYSAEEALGRTPGELLSSGKSDPQAIKTLLDGAQSGVACRVELINRAKDGREYWADTEVQPTLDARGQLVGFMEIGTDITQPKKIQLQLEAAMREARALLNTVQTHAIVSTTDAHGNITDVNHAFCQISGYSHAELVGVTHRIVNSGTHPQAFWVDLWQTISSGKSWRGEICNRSKDGALYWVDSMIAPFVGEGGQIEKYISIRIDITARHQAAKQLRQSEATFAASFQAAASGMGFLTLKGQWTRVNPALSDFLGYSEEELQELTLHDTNHPDEWEIDQLQLTRLMDGEIAVYQRAKRYLHRDGHTLWGLASVSVVRNSDGQPQFVITQIVDITARKRAEEALGLSNALMEESQAVAKVGGWEFDLVSSQLYWTGETYRIHETSPEEFDPTLEAGLDFYLPESRARFEEAFFLATEEGRGFDLELEILTAKGRHLQLRATCTARLERGRVVRLSGIFQDITERVQYERSLHEAREKAELATRSKGQFLANMSHEIRTPMNAILGMLKLLRYTELSQRQQDYASKAESAAKSLLGLINDILDFSKVEAGKMQLEAQPFRLETLLRDLAVILSSNGGASPIEVLYDIDPMLPEALLGDAMRLKQVLINLGGNAIKFTSQGQVVVRLRLQQRRGSVVAIEFAVQDSGIGIAPENQAHIFTGFSQAEASTTRIFGGTGLGLSISQRLVELMGGKLGLTSALGQGSTFFFTLELPEVGALEDAMQVATPAAAPRRALVVDANPVARALLAQMVASLGWPVEEADSGEAALDLLAERLRPGDAGFDVVYIGWRMAGLDGWASTARLRQLCAQAPCPQPVVVMVSANSRESLDQRTQEEQGLLNGFLVKPVTAAMLMDAALEPSSAAIGLRHSQRGGASQRRLSGMRILVVEDNLLNQQVAEELLMTEGALVSLAANGRLGVEAIAAASHGQPFDVVLMDIQMPVLDGFAATRIVREDLHLHALPIVAMTANAQQSDRDQCLAAGMNEHVGKPFDLRQLVSTLLRLTGFQVQPDASVPSQQDQPPDLHHNADVDVAAALARMGGHRTLYQQTAREFLRTLPSDLAQLQAGLASDLRNAGMRAHTLKGLAATLGATPLARAAAELEQCCKDNRAVAERQAALGAVQAAAASAVRGLQAVLDAAAAPAVVAVPGIPGFAGAQTEPADRPDHDRSALPAALAELTALLDAQDFAALEKYADLRDALETVPPDLRDPLELALQGLELVEAASHCRAIGAWLADSDLVV